MGTKLLYMLPALALALLALVLALVGLSRDPEPVPPPTQDQEQATDARDSEPEYRYWVVRESMAVGDTLGEENLGTVSSPSSIPGALDAEDEVTGQELARQVRAGELLSDHHFQAGGSLPANLPDGQRAIAISVDDVIGAGGLLQPGDRVDVATAFRRSDKDGPAALVMLKDVPVLAVRGALSASENDDEDGNRRRNNTAVLSVPQDKIPALMLASSEGTVRLAVVSGKREDGEEDTRSEDDKDKPFYFDDFFPETKQPAPAAPRRPAGQRVEIFEGAESRSTYVQ